MDDHDNLLLLLGKWWEKRQVLLRSQRSSAISSSPKWLPTPGNAIFTLVVIIGLLWAQSAGALPLAAPSTTSTGTIAYQGRLANTAGQPLTGTYNMTFRLYAAASGGAPLWEETWTGPNSVQVSDGLFNVMLGSLSAIPQAVVAGNASLFLGITVGTDSEMSPRVQLGSVPFAVQALTVPDGSITAAKIADGEITQTKAPTLLMGADGNNRIIRSGSTLVTTDAKGEVCIPLNYNFPTRVTSFAAMNGDIYLSTATVIGTLSLEQYIVRSCVTVRVSVANSTLRINWIALGY